MMMMMMRGGKHFKLLNLIEYSYTLGFDLNLKGFLEKRIEYLGETAGLVIARGCSDILSSAILHNGTSYCSRKRCLEPGWAKCL